MQEMTHHMTHRERVTAALQHKPVDRLPVSVWGHDFLREGSAEDLAAQTIEKQRTYGYDFVKVNPRWTLFAEPWGNVYKPPQTQEFPRLVEKVVGCAEDMAELTPVHRTQQMLAEHTQALRMVTEEIGAEVDCLATLFSPLAVLGLLCGGVGRPLTAYLQEDPGAAHKALEHITATLSEHALDLLDAGASGVFFAPLQWTSLDVCPETVYAQFGEAYDRRLLDQVAHARFNVLHVCGSNIGLSRFYDYPVHVLNWDNFDERNPDLQSVAGETDKVVAGGIPHKRLHRLDESELAIVANEAVGDMRQGVMLAGGCGIGALVPHPPREAVVSVARSLT